MKKSIADREDAAADAAEAEAAEQAGASRYRGGHRGELGALDAYVAPRGARGASERGTRRPCRRIRFRTWRKVHTEKRSKRRVERKFEGILESYASPAVVVPIAYIVLAN
jgi:hypothetical protein